MTKLFGLPAHALLVHAPIVLTPLIVLLCAVVLTRPALRARFGWVAVGGAAVMMVSMFAAKQSGEAFEEALVEEKIISNAVIERHSDLGDQTFVLSLLFFVIVLVSIVVMRRRTDARTASRILASASVVVGVLAVIWTVRTGHEGASVVWEGVLP